MYRLNTDLGAVAHLERFSLEMSQIAAATNDDDGVVVSSSPPQSQLEKFPSLKK